MMHDRCLQCAITLLIDSVRCPGVRFPSRSALYVGVQLFDRAARTSLTTGLSPAFPLEFNEEFRFSKIYCGRRDFADVLRLLHDELVILRLIRRLDDRDTTLAIYRNNLRDFLFPSVSTTSTSQSRSTSTVRLGDVDGHLFLRLTPVYPGSLEPKLKFCAATTIQVLSPAHAGCYCSGCCDCSFTLIAPRKRRRGRTRLRFASNVGHDRSRLARINLMASTQDRPAFVIRRVDSRLLGRIPSLYRENPGRKTYCCVSPHRYDDCAACRVSTRRQSPSPTRRSRRTSPALSPKKQNNGHATQNTRAGRRRERHESNNNSRTNRSDVDQEVYRSDDDDNYRNGSVDRIGSAIIPIDILSVSRGTTTSPQRNSLAGRATTPPPAHSTPRAISPILRSPTFQERFGKLPEDAIVRRRNRSASSAPPPPPVQRSSAAPSFRNAIDRTQDPADSRDDEYHVHCKQHESRRPCHCCHQCSNPYCTSYWMSRLGSPIPYGPYNWYSFRHDLACAYDDYYRKLYEC